MDGELYIILPLHPAAFGVFLGILVASLVYYGIKFVASLVTGG